MKKLSIPVQKIPKLREKKGITTIPDMVEYSCGEYSTVAYSIMTDNGLREFTFPDVYRYVTRFAAYLSENGFGKGDHIAILSENRPEWGISFFALSWIGAVVIPLDARANQDNHRFILGFSSARALISSDQFYSNAEDYMRDCSNLEHIFSIDSIDSLVEKRNEGIDRIDTDHSDLCEILFTSGTTGTPKGVMLTHGNLMSNVEDVYSFLDINNEDTAFSILPLHHCYECTGGLLSTFYAGVRVHYSRGLRPNILLEDLKTANPTIWMNTPLVLEKLYKRIRREMDNQNYLKKLLMRFLPGKLIGSKVKKSLGLKNIRYIVSGGAALPDWVQKGLEDMGFPLIQGYGLSESAPLISANPPGRPRNESVGMVIDSVDAKIVDMDKEGNGEIYVKGPNVMSGYYKNPEDTGKVLTEDGWLKTGDIGYFDEDGYLYITGRKKNVIVTKGGKNIFPEELEEKILESPLVEEIMVFSPDDESIHALIYPNLEELEFNYDINDVEDERIHGILQKEIRNVNKTMESYKRISKIAVKREEFPKTTTNKIKRYLYSDLDIRNRKII